MTLLLYIKRISVVFFFLSVFQKTEAQFLMDMVDTTKDLGKGLLSMYKRYDHLRIGGYMQPQFQVAQEKGARSFSGGDFAPHVNNRFMLRRGRVRFDYAHFNEQDQPTVQFAFQFDGTERGVAIRDFWGRFFENKWQLFQFTGGMFARPFGYEVNLSSVDREAPERGRMSQTLMKTERDLGAMITVEPRRTHSFLRYLKFDAGVFNGQGLTGPGEYDSYKDLICRLYLKSYPLTPLVSISGGLSFFQGGLMQPTKYLYWVSPGNTGKDFQVDSTESNFEAKAPRNYRGADMQWKVQNDWGFTELRVEYWWGTQTATENSTETPGVLTPIPYYIRKFDGAFICFLQNIVNKQHQLVAKYDWYDPNTEVKGKEIGKTGTHFTPADIRYNTLGLGYIYYISQYLKLTLWYDRVSNEATSLPGFTDDLKDDVFTCRLQFRF